MSIEQSLPQLLRQFKTTHRALMHSWLKKNEVASIETLCLAQRRVGILNEIR
jgi:uncharacterized protein YggL (DUF469 family)